MKKGKIGRLGVNKEHRALYKGDRFCKVWLRKT